MLRFVHQILRAVARGESREAVLSSLAQGACHLCGADVAIVALLGETGEYLDVVTVYGAAEPVQPTPVPVSGCLSGLVIQSGKTFRCADLSRLGSGVACESADVRGILIAPLPGPSGALGTLSVGKVKPFRCTPEQEVFIHGLATTASLVVQLSALRAGSQARRTAGKLIGELPIAESLRARLTPLTAPSPSERFSDIGLSRRDREVLQRLASGSTSKEIAAHLGLSSRTVEHYVERLKLRYGAANLHGLMAQVTPILRSKSTS
jgi:DNA-binding CsgD family transcriptional regulator